MRVLFVTPGELTGSHLPFVRREAEALRTAGILVDVYAFDNTRYSPAYLVTQVLDLRGAIRRMRPDVVHAQFGKFNALVAALAALGRAPLVISFRGTDINRNTRYSALRSAIGIAASQAAAFLADGLICVSREIRDKVKASSRRACLLVPTGVDLKTFVAGDRAAARRRLGFGADERIVLFNSGRNPAVKDPELAAQAFEDARRRIGDARLVVLDGSAAPDEIPHYMNAADVLLVTSRTEGSPTVVQEAMACNLPVVSVDVGDVRERLEGVKDCAVVARCPIALGMALAEVLRAPRRSDGRVHAKALGVDAIAARIAGFYRDLLAARANRDLASKYRSAE